MDAVFEKTAKQLISTLEEMHRKGGSSRTEVQKDIRTVHKLAQELDAIQRIAEHGFNSENTRISEQIYKASSQVFKEMEAKELALKEAEATLAETNSREASLAEIMEYGSMLSRYAKCPLLWTEGTALPHTFPAYPTDAVIQDSVLRIKTPQEEHAPHPPTPQKNTRPDSPHPESTLDF